MGRIISGNNLQHQWACIAALPWCPCHFEITIGVENDALAALPLRLVAARQIERLLEWDVVAGLAEGVVNFDFGDGCAYLNFGAAHARTAPARGTARSLL